MIRLQGVGMQYRSHGAATRHAPSPVLHDVSLDLGDGDLTVVIGASGCGKTTLLNLVAGFITPTSGSLSIDGKPICAPGPERAVVFQDDALLPWQTVAENIGFGLRLAGMAAAQRATIVAHYLDLTGLGAHADYPIWKISGGMRQRVGLARALAISPRYLLLDEPLGALDALTREHMQQHLLTVWHAAKRGMLMITHSVEEALFLATDLVVMRAHPGRIAQRHQLDFGRRFVAGESARAIKSSRAFVELREEILADLMRTQELTA
ncbi:MAG: taurine ABC transporter ATP-binding protein [Janthinobacterium lividum]